MKATDTFGRLVTALGALLLTMACGASPTGPTESSAGGSTGAPMPPPPQIPPIGAMSWCGFTAPLSRCDAPDVEILSSQLTGTRRGLYVQDSRQNVLGSMTFTVRSVGQPNGINDREVVVDVSVTNFISRCEFIGSAGFYSNGRLFTNLSPGIGVRAAPNSTNNVTRTLMLRNGTALTVRPESPGASLAFPSC